MDALKRCAKEHLGGQLVIVHVYYELEYFVQIQSSPETFSGVWESKGYSHGVSKLKSGGDDGLRSTIKWYFWSPSDTVKNCPTPEYVRTHLAPLQPSFNTCTVQKRVTTLKDSVLAMNGELRMVPRRYPLAS